MMLQRIKKILGVVLRDMGKKGSYTIKNNGVFKKVKIDITGKGNIILIGKNTVIENVLIYVKGNNNSIEFGSNGYMHGGEIWIEDDNCKLLVRDKTTIENAHLAITENGSALEIGRDCMIAKNVEIRTGDSHSIINALTGNRINQAGHVIVEDHVWIGGHAKILKGVTIGKNAIIGTASVVSRSVPPGCIAAGIPAKIIRENINWDRRRLP